MDLRLALRQTIKLVVPSPKGDLFSVAFLSRHSRAGLWILPSLSGLVYGTDLWSDKLVVPSPKGDLVSVAFLSRHSRAGLWILPSLSGLVCGKDDSSVPFGTGLRKRFVVGRDWKFAGSVKETTHPKQWHCFSRRPVCGFFLSVDLSHRSAKCRNSRARLKPCPWFDRLGPS